jgi:hypothetical protein
MTIVVEIASRTGTRAYLAPVHTRNTTLRLSMPLSRRRTASFEHTPSFGLQASRLIRCERCSEYQRKKT